MPNIQAIQDRAVIEVARGCTRGCRFCQACFTYRPVRERKVGTILKLARETILETGYREISLISLSISNYSSLGVLIKKLDEEFSPHGISFSLPSLRLDSFNADLADKVKEIRKSGLTFAVEGGSQFVRDYINKGVNEEDLLSVINIAKEKGWKSIKLYFMIGLIGEGPVDETLAIAELVKKIAISVPGISLTVSIAVFIPKPHTPFQWKEQLSAREGRKEFSRLIELIKKYKRINIRYNSPDISFLEGVFSRGDRRLSEVIEKAFSKGARFDGWTDRINFSIWEAAFSETGISPDFYLSGKSEDALLPWDIIDMGAGEDYIHNELKKSMNGELTRDCRTECSDPCGNCDFDEILPVLATDEPEDLEGASEEFLPDLKISSKPMFLGRLLYSRNKEMRYISPTDFDEIISRALIRSNIPVCYSSGFNPHIRFETMWALPSGFESDYEVSEIELARDISFDEFQKSISPKLPAGLAISGLKVFPFPYTKISRLAKDQFIRFKFDPVLDLENAKINLAKSVNFMKITSKASKTINLNDFVKSLGTDDGKLVCDYFQVEGGARIQDIIEGITGYGVRKAVTLNPKVIDRYILINGEKISIFKV